MAKRRKHLTPGERLRQWLDERNETQTAFAPRVGLKNVSSLNNILASRSRPSLRVAVQIEQETQIPALDFASAEVSR